MASRLLKALQAIFNPPEDTGDGAQHRRHILTEYKLKRPVYEEFSVAIHRLIGAFLREGGYKCQITYRTKTPDRLREKLIRKAAQGIQYDRLENVEDLAGVRVLFYTEADKDRFVREITNEISGAIRVEIKKGKSGYDAVHLIIELGPKRLQLSEYKHFSEKKCEVQVTTMLRHTWAEIEHDLIYKDINGLQERDPEKFSIMRNKLNVIMEKYIKKASREFEDLVQEMFSSR